MRYNGRDCHGLESSFRGLLAFLGIEEPSLAHSDRCGDAFGDFCVCTSRSISRLLGSLVDLCAEKASRGQGDRSEEEMRAGGDWLAVGEIEINLAAGSACGACDSRLARVRVGSLRGQHDASHSLSRSRWPRRAQKDLRR